MVEIRYFAAARAARGAAHEVVPADSTIADTLADLLDDLGTRHTDTTAGGMTLAGIFDRCSFLVDGRTVTRPDASETPLTGVGRVDVLPPFAGG